jgi:hypothetical protein
MILTEAARNSEGGDMTPEEAKKLIEAGIREANKPLLQRLIRADAKDEAARLLESVTLPKETKARVVDRVLNAIPLTETGALDTAKLGELVVKEAKAEGEYLAQVTGSGRVFGMNSGPAIVEDPKKAKKQFKEAKAERKEHVRTLKENFMRMGMPEEAAKIAARGKVA